MKTIWRFELDDDHIAIPQGGKPLTVQFQNGRASLWAEVETSVNAVFRAVKIMATGQTLAAIANADEYIGTWQEGSFVWHLYLGPEVDDA